MERAQNLTLNEERAPVGASTHLKRHLFLRLLHRHLTEGAIRFLIDGQTVDVGETASGPKVVVRVHRPRMFDRVIAAGNLGLGEAYMDGDYEIESGTLTDFITVLLRNRLDERFKRDPAAAAAILGGRIVNVLRGKRDNIRRHYDLGNDLFESFLDSTLTYSCGYARDVADDVEKLQQNKLDRICQKLRLKRGETLLDIGCGFGALLIFAAKNYGAMGTGITISTEQHQRALQNARTAGVTDRVQVEFQDHTKHRGSYDKIVSVGMMEHVPRREYGAYFRNIARMLRPGGLGLVHTIGCNAAVNEHDPFIQKYIFPASNQPRLSEITGQLEKHRLSILDVENMARHYGFTAARWLERFEANSGRLDSSKYDERFKRMWRYYLACGVSAFSNGSDSALYQVLFTTYRSDMPFVWRV